MGAPYAVVSECQQTNAGANGRRGLSAVMGGLFLTVVLIDAAAWGGRLWESGMGCEQHCVGWDGSRGSDEGGGGVGQTRVHELVRHVVQRAVVAVV